MFLQMLNYPPLSNCLFPSLQDTAFHLSNPDGPSCAQYLVRVGGLAHSPK